MRRLIETTVVLAVVFTLVSASVSAQGLTGKGFKAGLNIANVHGDDIPDECGTIMGLCAGGFITYSINEMFAIQPELLYTMKGSKCEDELPALGNVEMTFSLNYLEIPVLAKLTIPTQGSVKPNLFVGPALGINLSAKLKVEAFGESEEEDIEDVKSTDFGVVFGGGVDFGLGQGKITFDARYTLGLTTTDESEEEADMKNNVISLMVGYSF